MQKECNECNKSVSYKNWSKHVRTEKHIENIARFKILYDRKREQEKKDLEQEERINAEAEKVVEKFRMLELNRGADQTFNEQATFNPVFKKKSKIVFNHHPNLPNNFRMLMLGESNCGKTNLLLKMILTPGIIDFNNLIIFSSTTEQLEYQLIYHGFKNNLTKEDIIKIFKHSEDLDDFSIEGICYGLRREYSDSSCITCQLSSSENEILHPNDIPTIRDCDGTTVKTLMVFDDLVCVTNQSLMAEYFVLGRHYNINTIYLTQSLIKVPKNGIRDNINMLILFHLSKTDLRYLYTNLFKYLDDKLNENMFFDHMERTLLTKYSHATYNKDKRSFIANIIQTSNQTSNQTSIQNEPIDEEISSV